jgi:uncharacterized membrane protein YphA (DoxX/SURF4 family)
MEARRIFGLEIITLVQIAALLFIAITFLQAGLDKFFDYKNNKEYFTSHFKGTLLEKPAPMLLPVIMVMELVTGALAIAGVVCLLFQNAEIGFYATITAMLTLLCLFFGQRVGKFYGEAAGIIPYMIMVLMGMLVFL